MKSMTSTETGKSREPRTRATGQSKQDASSNRVSARKTAAQLLINPILERMRPIDGWLADPEARLLIGAVRQAVKSLPNVHAIVEIGSFCGKSTVVMGGALALGHGSTHARVFAIDPHEGVVGAVDNGIYQMSPTLEVFRRNISEAGLAEFVETIVQYSFKVEWRQPICFMFIDGLHDYENVSRDFNHFERWIADGGLVAFHDYAPYFPGVKTFVDELMAGGRYAKVDNTLSLIVLRKKETHLSRSKVRARAN